MSVESIKAMEAELATIKDEAEAKVQEYNNQFQSEKLSEALDTEEKVKELCKNYLKTAKAVCFAKCSQTEDPMVEAARILVIETIGTKTTRVGTTKIPVVSIVKKYQIIDPLELHRKLEKDGGIGHDKLWDARIEQFNLEMTVQVARDIKSKRTPEQIKNCYAMRDIARDINLGKNPTSNTQMLKTLNGIIEAMVGSEFKATSHDVAFMKNEYTKGSRKVNTIKCADHRTLRKIILQILHNVITGEGYDVEFKEEKD